VKRVDSGLISDRVIHRMAREIVERFHPQRIILFGSYAYGKPDPGSDVDLLVVMPTGNELEQAVRIRSATTHPFALDLIVRTPQNLRRRIHEGDWFLREIVTLGKVLYEQADGRVGEKGRGRPGSGRKAVPRTAAS